MNWIELYSDVLDIGYTFELYKHNKKKHIIKADTRLSNELFSYLVNYVHYAEGFDGQITVEGFTIVKDEDFFPTKWREQQLLLFIPNKDTEYDNVYAVSKLNEIFKIDFGATITKPAIEKQFQKPTINFSDLDLSKKFKVEKQIDKKYDINEVNKNDMGSRFIKISLTIFMFYFLSYAKFKDTEAFLAINSGISFLVWIWFFSDYKMLRSDKYFLKALMWAIGIFLYGYYFSQRFSLAKNSRLILISTVLPIFFLVLQRPSRHIFIQINDREPVIDKPAPTFEDWIYAFFLLMGSTLIPPLIYNLIH